MKSYRINEIWSIDLADMQLLAADNGGIRYILVAVDTLSRFLHAESVKSKSALDVKNAFIKMLKRRKVRPEKVWSDRGTEFAGSFKTFCKNNGIEMYSTFSETKSAFAERNIRSLKALIYRYLNENHTNRYIGVLQHFVNIINSRPNRVMKMAPKDVTSKHTSYLVALSNNNNNNNSVKSPKFHVGDTVRIRRKIDVFHKGYKIQFSHELFKVAAILTNSPATYQIVDESDQIIQGRFYEPELVKFAVI